LAGDLEDPINMGNFRNVIAIFDDGSGLTAGYHFTNIATSTNSATLVEGLVDTNGLPGGTNVIGSANVYFEQYFSSSCSGYIPQPSVMSATPSTTDGKTADTPVLGYGTSGSIDALTYHAYVMGMNDYFLDSTETLLMDAVNDPVVNFTTTLGGTIAGNIIQRNGSTPIQGTYVGAYDAMGMYYGPVTSDTNGHYELDVPAGTYMVSVYETPDDGALTEGIVVVSNATTTQNFVRGPYTGDVTRLSDSQGIDDGSFWGTSSTMTDSTGNFTLRLYDGINYVCVNPNTSTTGHNVEFECFYNLDIDALEDLDD